MEFEFDKEMDSLLRQTAKSDILFPKQNSNAEHIDADEISMFAENALPEKAKPRVMKHLADCNKCRTILSNVMVLNAEAEEVAVVPATTAKAETIVASTEPSWFQKLFATRNLAFGMGALAVIFAVGIGFIVVQNISNGSSELAKETSSDSAAITERQAEPNPQDDVAEQLDDSNSESKDVSSETDTRPDSNIESSDSDQSVTPASRKPADVVPSQETNKSKEKPIDTDIRKPVAKKAPKIGNIEDKAVDEEVDTIINSESRTINKPLERADDIPTKPGSITPAPPITTRGSRAKRKVELEKKDAASGVSRERKKLSANRKVKGKTFTRKNNVWTDSAYKNQKITTVRRGTSAYRNLDKDLQSIGNQLNGTVIVVWKSKAYKIQ